MDCGSSQGERPSLLKSEGEILSHESVCGVQDGSFLLCSCFERIRDPDSETRTVRSEVLQQGLGNQKTFFDFGDPLEELAIWGKWKSVSKNKPNVFGGPVVG